MNLILLRALTREKGCRSNHHNDLPAAICQGLGAERSYSLLEMAADSTNLSEITPPANMPSAVVLSVGPQQACCV
jgi:hypothetical protein